MHILLPSDVFPPGSVGGAAWSAYTLAHALQADYHTVTAVVPVPQGTQPPQSETQIPTVYHLIVRLLFRLCRTTIGTNGSGNRW
ncbi:MAG: glycosyltransferase family 4 protein, partial [Chloroflexaceae bacterium]|nr:glycosyltransferase family 4 protein [Chloroflexaceae bacterium]